MHQLELSNSTGKVANMYKIYLEEDDHILKQLKVQRIFIAFETQFMLMSYKPEM